LMKSKIYIIGMGPGKEEMMTGEAIQALDNSDVIIGYTVYVKLLGERFEGKEMLTTPMRQETERCRLCFEEAAKGKQVALICSGDAGIYGLASLMYEIGKDYPETELIVIPGITAANSGAAVLGAPLNHDFCVISLSDLLTPWEKIEKRLIAAAEGDFAMAIYNPSSHKRKDYLMRACDILLRVIEEERPCGFVENIGREGTRAVTCTLKELRETQVNMFTTVFIGNSGSELVNGKLITKRGYQLERNTDICRNNGR
jgi:precorrin-3B C17-methyltransferase